MSNPRPQTPETEPKYDPRRPFPATKLLYQHDIPTIPGKTIIGAQVTCPPNAATPPHTHSGAFISAYIFSGYIINKMNNEPVTVLGPGDTFKENPGCKHKICENPSRTHEAIFFVTIIIDTEVVNRLGYEGLLTIDEEYREMVMVGQNKT